MTKEKVDAGTVQLVTLVGVIAVLALGLAGGFAGKGANLTKEDVREVVKAELGGTAAAPAAAQPQPTQPAEPVAATKLEVKEFKDFYDKSYVLGNEKAKVTLLEFSDFQCPFCKRFADAGTLEEVKNKYGEDVNIVFTHFPLSFHPLAQKAQEAAECVGEQAGAEGYYVFKKALFAEAEPTRENITKVAGTISGVDAEKMNKCIDDGKYATKVADAMNFGRKLGVTGTPGTIVVNNETGEFAKVSGAVPAASFDAPVGQYLQ